MNRYFTKQTKLLRRLAFHQRARLPGASKSDGSG